MTNLNVKTKNPEIVGTETMDLSMDSPMMGKVSLKITSTVASSIVAQEKLNAIARENINFLGEKIAEGISYIMDNAYSWVHRIHEIDMLHEQWRKEAEG